jgi:threonine synthase
MTRNMYYSTNHQSPDVTLSDALLTGQAPDKGLYMPRTIPQVTPDEIHSLKDKPYSEVALFILQKYALDTFSREELKALCDDAYDYEVPIEQVMNRQYIIRLDRGPTASFKDFAARMMGRMIGALMRNETRELVILTATSGDTGSAIAHAFFRIPNIKVMVLFPPAEVSNRQRKQMTTLGENVSTVAVDGQFDDCQALVKQAFADPALSAIRLSSANSINIGRLLPQIVYYFYAYASLAERDEPVVFSVPSGNFGDMMGCLLAQRMGLPVKRLIIATNANDEVPRFVETNRYEKIVPSRVCISNAMNVGHPSNFARVIDLFGGHMDETGALHKMPDMATLRDQLWAVSVNDETTRETIRTAWQDHRVLLEPHGAVGWSGLKQYVDATGDTDSLIVSVETAHPAKFPEEIQSLLSIMPDIPPSMQGLEERAEAYHNMPVDYEVFKTLLMERYGQ